MSLSVSLARPAEAGLSSRRHPGRAPAFHTLAAAAALGAVPLTGHAQATPAVAYQELPQVVVTAADLEQPLARTIAHTTLIDEAEIRRSGQADLASLLRGVAGVDIAQNGAIGNTSSVFLRGAAGTQVLVLVDGMRIGSATLGSAPLEQLMLDQIERVEIVRGNVSALYGAGAVGGVIQVFTRKGQGPRRASVAVEAGSYGTARASGSVQGQEGDTAYAMTLSGLRTRGYTAMDPAASAVINPDRDGYRNTSASGSVSHKVDAVHQIGLRAFVSNGRSAYDSSFAGAATDEHTLKSATRELSAHWQARWSSAWTTTLRLGAARDESHATESYLGSVGTTRFDTLNQQVDLRNEVRLAPGHTLLVGLQRVQQKVDSTTVYDRSARRTDSLSASYNGDLGPLQTQLAWRHDRVEGGSGASSGLLGLALPLDEAWRLTGTGSTAFNLPNFNQLYYPGFGNPALRPEKARSLELGGQYEAGGTLARLVWFTTHYRDLIDSPAPTYATINVNRARSQGLEFSGSTRVEDWLLKLQLTHQQPRDRATGEVLNRRARDFGSLDVAREFGPWQVGGQLVAVGQRRDGQSTLAGYVLANLQGQYQLAPGWSARARLNNLTDARYQTVQGYVQPGREAYLGLVWQP